MKKKKPTVRNITTKRKPPIERTVEEQIQILWKVIDEANMHLDSEMSTSEEKRHWAKVICDTMGVLTKVQATRREKSPEDEDLGSLLFKVPKTMRRAIVRRVRKWRRRNLSAG
ncbi:hypothetical protein IBX38_07225 [Candidatus Bathyarchaeota archaeon]|nr:hypothetical protein [Candidatus Bathyarchaeota archaeon]